MLVAARSAVVALLGAVLVLVPDALPASTQEPDGDWRELLERAVSAARETPFQGRLVVVAFDTGGPFLAEVTVVQDGHGVMQRDPAEDWVLGHTGEGTFYGEADSGTLLRLGEAERGGFSIDRLTAKYEVVVAATEPGLLGPTAVCELRERASGVVREVLHIDEGSGLVVRRETFDRDGDPVRLTAFTALEVDDVILPTVDEGWRQVHEPSDRLMSSDGVGLLRDLGAWRIPEELPLGYELVAVYALDEGASTKATTLHLVYSDGLYTLSLFEQKGLLDPTAVAASGGVRARLGSMDVHRWPGTEPATIGWSGDGLTFTVVSTAPGDELAAALDDLPRSASRSSVGHRLRRGLARIVDGAWPFD